MSELNSKTPAQTIMSFLAAICFSLLAVGVALLITFSAPAVRMMLDATHQTQAANQLRYFETVAEDTRQYVTSEATDLPFDETGLKGYDSAMIGHLGDVRGVIGAARALTWALLVVVALVVSGAFRRKRFTFLAQLFKQAGIITVGGLCVLGLVMAVNFESVFTLFHQMLFAHGTWTFSAQSLLIVVFPEQFWFIAAMSLAALTIGIGVLYLTIFVGLQRKSADFSIDA